MAITLTELQQKLMLIDEISVMEILEITSEDLAQRFLDRIEIKYDQLITEFENEEEDSLPEVDESWWEDNENYNNDDDE